MNYFKTIADGFSSSIGLLFLFLVLNSPAYSAEAKLANFGKSNIDIVIWYPDHWQTIDSKTNKLKGQFAVGDGKKLVCMLAFDKEFPEASLKNQLRKLDAENQAVTKFLDDRYWEVDFVPFVEPGDGRILNSGFTLKNSGRKFAYAEINVSGNSRLSQFVIVKQTIINQIIFSYGCVSPIQDKEVFRELVGTIFDKLKIIPNG